MDYREAVGAMHRLELLRRIKARGLMAEGGLHPGQPRLLQFIREHPGCTQKEAADDLDVTPASAAASLKRLEKAGFVSRSADPRDARRNRLFVTDQGIAQMDEKGRQFEALDQRIRDDIFLSDTTRQLLHFGLRLQGRGRCLSRCSSLCLALQTLLNAEAADCLERAWCWSCWRSGWDGILRIRRFFRIC